MKRIALAILFLLLMTVSSTAALLPQPQAADIYDHYPSPVETRTTSMIAPEADDSHFVADSGGDLDQYLFRTDVAGGRLRFQIPITRYYFNSNDPNIDFDGDGFLTDSAVNHILNKHILPETALLRLRVYDVDEEATWCPEVDLIFVNDEPIFANGQQARLSGANDTWSTPSFQIPIEVLKFPQGKGNNAAPTPVDNEISIRIDANDCTTSTGDPAWAVEVDWGEIEIPSPIRPILFAHGWTGSTNSFNYIEDQLADDGIPSAGQADLLEGIYPIAQTSGWLAGYIYAAVLEFGVDKVNLFAHSKGGLVSRLTLRLPAASRHTEHLITFASPHHGTMWAEHTNLMRAVCTWNYPTNPVKANLCYNAAQEFRRDRVREELNYSGCTYKWWPLPPHWEGCQPRYVQQPSIEYYSLAANQDLDVLPLASTTYPWNADAAPFPNSINVNARFNASHGGLISNQSAYECAIHLLNDSLYSCPTLSVESAPVLPEDIPQQTILSDSGTLAAGGNYSVFASVDGGNRLVFEAYGDHAFTFTLVEPGGRVVDPSVAASDPNITYDAQDDGVIWQYRYHITNPMTGDWENRLQTSSELHFALWGLSNSDTELHVKMNHFTYQPGDNVVVEAAMAESGVPATGATLTGMVTHPDDSTEPLAFNDNGAGADAQANDGIYTAQFAASATNGHTTIEIMGQKGDASRMHVADVAIADQTAALQGIVSEMPVDGNLNGLCDYLDITANIQVLQSGYFDFQASLVDSQGQLITTAYYSTRQDSTNPWPVGTHLATFSFDGKAISHHGVDGPYTLTNLSIFDTTDYSLQVDWIENVYTTAAYQARMFERPTISVVDGHEVVLDLDGNGRYDRLTISLDVDVVQPGDYEANGRLVDPAGGEITWAADSFYAANGGIYQIELEFDGNSIGTHQVDGPYTLQDLSVFNTTGTGSSTFNDIFTTQAYPFTAFEGGYARIYVPVIVKAYNPSPTPTWHPGTNIESRAVYGLAVSPNDCNALYAATDAGLYKSTDGGASWAPTGLNTLLAAQALNPEAPPFAKAGDEALSATLVSAVTTDPANSQVVYATTWGSGIYKSTDGGASWTPVNAGLGDLWLYAIVADPSSGQVLYAGANSGGVFKSTDGGGSWFAANNGLANLNLRSLAVDPANSQLLYAGTQGGVYKSADGGGWWAATGALGAGDPWAIAVDSTNSQTLYAGLGGSGVYKSTNGGGVWFAVNNGLGSWDLRALILDPSAPQTLYAGTNGAGVYTSTNGGNTWGAMNDSLGNWMVKALCKGTSCGIIHAGTENGAWRYGP